MVKILTLDLSSTSGAAVDGPDGRPLFATHKDRMPMDDDFGPLFGRKAKWMREMIQIHKPDRIAVERPFVPIHDARDDEGGSKGRPTSERIIMLLVGLWAVAVTVADAHRIPCARRAASTARKTFLGTGRTPPGEDIKKIVLRRCFLLGWSPANDHEADSGCLWAHEKTVFDSGFVLPPQGMVIAPNRMRVTA